jgi:hypothetical protein
MVLLALVGGLTYAGFFWVPEGPRRPAAFDPDKLAVYQLEVFEAYDKGADFGLFVAYTKLLREQNRYTWFKAADTGFHMARVSSALRNVHSHYEQLLPDLEYVYTVERDWLKADFNPAAVAQAHLTAWVSAKAQVPNTLDVVANSLATRDALRFKTSESATMGAAALYARAEALRDQEQTDWPTVFALLTDASRSLALSVR